MIRRHLAASLAVVLFLASPAWAQQADSSLLTLTRVYGSGEFASQKFGPSRWLGDGSAYTTLEAAAGGQGEDIIRYDVESGRRDVMVAAPELTPRGADAPLEV
ncbi:MAG TPA: hypothetical protein VFN40_10835, partial [Gemmatimonadales bacterium]|nr:hypothetical protein [Gemmatimonadales bacterium]